MAVCCTLISWQLIQQQPYLSDYLQSRLWWEFFSDHAKGDACFQPRKSLPAGHISDLAGLDKVAQFVSFFSREHQDGGTQDGDIFVVGAMDLHCNCN